MSLHPRRRPSCWLVVLLLVALVGGRAVEARAVEVRADEAVTLVPPAAPLVTCDPYFSIWSPSPTLADADTVHWTGKPHRLTSQVEVDGQEYRLMGSGSVKNPTPALKQTSIAITPTRTMYEFAGAGIELSLTFMTPALPDDIDLLSRPITCVTYDVRSADGKPHEVELQFNASAEIAVNVSEQTVVATVEKIGPLAAVKLGSTEQPVLAKRGDDLRIDWGYFYVAAPAGQCELTISTPDAARQGAASNESTPTSSPEQPRRADQVAASLQFDLGEVRAEPVSRTLILAYDDLYSIEYMHRRLRPYWRRNGLDAAGLLQEAARDYESLVKRCEEFDRELMADLEQAGGKEYAALAALAYRQCFAAGKFVADANGQPLQFCKENHSNGCIATSDVFYPMAPQFMLFGPSLAKSFLVPFMDYAASDRWKFPFAPHDLGTYPKANGQVYGGGERTEENQMPVEESGNLLILMAAVAQMEGHADFAGRYWPQLQQWARYLKEEGFDPDNQLCTDDFAGHLAHNVNLSAKAICGLGAFAKLCEMRGDDKQAAEYRQVAKEFAARWVKEADDGDHFRLTFDRSGTWSQKYNLVWDRLLGLELFPPEVARKEMDYYLKAQNKYGLPLDNRDTYTKLDWILWTATLTGEDDDFRALVSPVVKFLNETPDRVPMTDWYQTNSGKRVGFTARPVVGGVFLKLLYDDAVWRKWASRDSTKAAGFAPMPKPPRVTAVLPAADVQPAEWRYTIEEPAAAWSNPQFNDAAWQTGRSGFGTRGTPGARIGQRWDGPAIWLRRTFDLAGGARKDLVLHVHHDEDAEIYINGLLAVRLGGYSTDYEQVPLSAEALAALKPTGNVMAVHCRQTGGGQYIDVGLSTVEEVD